MIIMIVQHVDRGRTERKRKQSILPLISSGTSAAAPCCTAAVIGPTCKWLFKAVCGVRHSRQSLGVEGARSEDRFFFYFRLSIKCK